MQAAIESNLNTCKTPPMVFKFCALISVVMLLAIVQPASAQQYHAMNGSLYAGSMATALNPGAIHFSPFKWDVTPLSVQLKYATNGYVIKNASLLKQSDDATTQLTDGTRSRFLAASQDLHLLNARIRTGPQSTIAFGANQRFFMYGSTSKINYVDTVYSLGDFLRINSNRTPLSAQLTFNSWTEIYASYARTIIEDDYRILSAGITLKYIQGIAGGYARLQDVRYDRRLTGNGREYFNIQQGSLQYGYNKSIDEADSSSSVSPLFKNRPASIGADLGIDLVLFPLDEAHIDNEPYEYRTRIGISLLDLGSNRYSHSKNSYYAAAGKPNVNDTLLESQFETVDDLVTFGDSLERVSGSFSQLKGDFSIYHPTRLVVTADQYITDHFFINASMTLPLIRIAGSRILYPNDLNLLSVTPRWETRRLGFYMPMLVNTRGQFWIGGAFRAGPLLLGLHNLGNLFSKNSMQNGGGYLAILIRPGEGKTKEPKEKNREKNRQQNGVRCPAF